MIVTPYLTFKGDCETAFKFYEKVLKGKIGMMLKHAGTPAESHTPPEWLDKILHARLDVGSFMLMGSDAPPQYQQTPAGFSVSLMIDDPAEAERVFKELAEGGQTKMPFQQTFWAYRFGMLIDKFGIPWMVNCEKEPGK